MIVTFAAAVVASEETGAAVPGHWFELGIILTNLGLIAVTLFLAWVTFKLVKTTAGELQHVSDNATTVANNSIDSMQDVATAVVARRQ